MPKRELSRGLVRFALLAPICALSIPSAADAQTRSLSWSETTRFEVPGTLGMFMRMAGGAGPTTVTGAIHVQGRIFIQEADQTAFVTDLGEGRMMTIDHASRTYTTLTFEEMARLTEQAMEEVYAAASAEPELTPEAAAAQREVEETRAELDFRLSAETTGERQAIGAHNATQHLITAEFEAREVPEGVEEPEGGILAFLGELWQTDDVPSEAQLGEEWARMLAEDPRFRDMAQDMVTAIAPVDQEVMSASLAAWDPQMGAGLTELFEAMEEIDGTTLRTTVTAAMVPLGLELDKPQLMAWQPSAGATLGNVVAGAAVQATADAARNALRGLGRGLLGGGSRDPEPAPAADPAPRVHPLFRLTITRDDLVYRESSDDVYGALQTRIADYRERTFADLSRPPQ